VQDEKQGGKIMVETINPSGGINECLIKCRCEARGKYYVIDFIGNSYEVSKETYNRLTCRIRQAFIRRK